MKSLAKKKEDAKAALSKTTPAQTGFKNENLLIYYCIEFLFNTYRL
ncbi:hypothetical protein [Commensalibacter papalotli (ex Servin-Garciduenas et al. 2014)]|nr:hypothetical protein [Commensalibacter papalotli (ex Servin-Garciduenas et al. 2014)]